MIGFIYLNWYRHVSNNTWTKQNRNGPCQERVPFLQLDSVSAKRWKPAVWGNRNPWHHRDGEASHSVLYWVPGNRAGWFNQLTPKPKPYALRRLPLLRSRVRWLPCCRWERRGTVPLRQVLGSHAPEADQRSLSPMLLWRHLWMGWRRVWPRRLITGNSCRQPPVNSRGFFAPKWPMFYPSNKRRLNRFCRAQKAFGYPYTGSCHVTVIHWHLCVFQISSKCPYKAFKPCQVSRKWNIVAEKCIWVPLGIFPESQESCQLQIITLNNTIIIT